jgi:hypothetical protein
MSKKIRITKGKFAIVDDEDFEYLNQWRWCLHSAGYAVRVQHISGSGKNRKRISYLMHQVVNKTIKGFHTDHINGDKLDNRKCNLRTLTASENIFYSGDRKNNTSGHKGVSWSKERNLWCAQIGHKKKVIPLGRYQKIEDAIKARVKAEKSLWH